MTQKAASGHHPHHTHVPSGRCRALSDLVHLPPPLLAWRKPSGPADPVEYQASSVDLRPWEVAQAEPVDGHWLDVARPTEGKAPVSIPPLGGLAKQQTPPQQLPMRRSEGSRSLCLEALDTPRACNCQEATLGSSAGKPETEDPHL